MAVTLVIGAAASGKSEFAESLCVSTAAPRVYLATMEPFGQAGRERIARHRALREGKGFFTLERPRDAADVAEQLPAGCVLLLEDVGNLVANELFSSAPGDGALDADAAARKVVRAVEALAARASGTVVVTVDAFGDGVRYDEGTEAWRRAVAEVNAQTARRAERVVEVVCGIPVWVKGEGSKR